jgi:hypothetical protein
MLKACASYSYSKMARARRIPAPALAQHFISSTEGADVERHGVELDAGRAAAASASGIATIHGNLFDTIAKSETLLVRVADYSPVCQLPDWRQHTRSSEGTAT